MAMAAASALSVDLERSFPNNLTDPFAEDARDAAAGRDPGDKSGNAEIAAPLADTGDTRGASGSVAGTEGFSALALQLVRRSAECGRGFRSGDGSVYTGRLGLAIAWMRVARWEQRSETGSAGSAMSALLAAEAAVKRAVEAMRAVRHRRVTMLAGDGGLAATHVMLGAMQGGGRGDAARDAGARVLLDRGPNSLFRQALSLPDVGGCEVLYGRCGFIQCVLHARGALGDASFGRDNVVEVAAKVVRCGRAFAAAAASEFSGWPLLWHWHDKCYLGAAHGVAGICYTLLCLGEDELTDIDRRDIVATVDALTRLEEADPALRGHFPSSLHPRAAGGGGGASSGKRQRRRRFPLVQWCHGAPGMVHLLCRAADVARADVDMERYAAAAARCGDAVWRAGLLHKGVGLCHGISGNAYAFARIARATGDGRWLQRAVAFARFAADNVDWLAPKPDHPASLFEGTLGLACLLLDLDGGGGGGGGGGGRRGGNHPRFPAFECDPIDGAG